jgi:hypothetical protein
MHVACPASYGNATPLRSRRTIRVAGVAWVTERTGRTSASVVEVATETRNVEPF